MLHRTAKLTPFGRRLLVEWILVEGRAPAIAAETWASAAPPPTSGCAAIAPKAPPGSRTDR